MKKIHLLLLFLLSFSLISFSSYGTHLMGGDITYTCNGNGNYDVKLRLYRDCNGINLGTTASIDIVSTTCNSSYSVTLALDTLTSPTVVTPICPSEPDVCLAQPNAVLGIEEFIYTGNITLPVTGCSDWIISWNSCCRNSAITTLSTYDSFYISSTLDDSNNNCNNSPTFFNHPIFYGCVNQPINYSHGVGDVDNDSLVFSLISCQPVTYNPGYSGTSPFSSLNGVSIDPTTGVISFTPTLAEVGVICVLVEEFRNGQKIGEYVRDIQMGMLNCANDVPQLSGINGTIDSTGSTGSNTLNTCLGSPVCFTIDSYDANAPTQSLTLTMSNSLPGASVSYSSGPTPQATICWSPTANDIGPNLFSIHVKDDYCPNVGESVYSYVINVGPDSNTVYISTPDTTISIGDSIQLTTVGLDSTCSISWSPAAGLSCTNCPNPIASPVVPTTYWATIDCGGCIVTDTIHVNAVVPFNDISGFVSNNSGVLDNVEIQLLSPNNYGIIGTTQTDAQGYYTLSTYHPEGILRIKPTTHTTEMMSYAQNAFVIQQATILTLMPNGTQDITTIEKVDLQGNGSLGGIIKDDMGNIVTNLRVVLTNHLDVPLNEAYTDNAGYIHFDNLTHGIYRFRADHKDVTSGIIPFTVVDAAYPNRDSLRFTLLSDRLTVEDLTNTTLVSSFSSLELFPNPASDVVVLKYQLAQNDFVDVQIFDIAGHKVATVQSEYQTTGQYQLNLQPFLKGQQGIYLIKIQTNQGIVTKRLVYR